MVNRELHSISSVPRASGEETYLTGAIGIEHVVSNVGYASTAATKYMNRTGFERYDGFIEAKSVVGDVEE
jgi:hypothetical protein